LELLKTFLFPTHPPWCLTLSFCWSEIDEDSTLKWGLARLVKGLSWFMEGIEIGVTFCKRYPVDGRHQQSGGWMAHLYCTPWMMFIVFNAILDFITWRRLWICLYKV
jgi:hypothetical protein